MKTNRILLPLVLTFCFILCFSCRQKTEQKQETDIEKLEQETVFLPDTIHSDLIRMYAELLYDSTSYIVLENLSPLPVTYNAEYRFEQETYGTWKTVEVGRQDTTRVILQPGNRDTLRMELATDIGYQPLGVCRVYKTISTLNGKQQFERMVETNARPQQIDWSRVDVIPDNTVPDSTFVSMSAKAQNGKIRVTLQNLTDREIIFGDGTNFSLSIFRDGQWYAISYARLEHNIAITLPPNGTINDMVHILPDVNYDFGPGHYRITKSYFFESDYRKKYMAGAEFDL